MAIRLLGILIAFAAGCLAAGFAMVLFVLTPAEVIGLPPDVRADRVAKGFELAGFVAAQVALFSTPFALVAAAVGEMLRNRNWTYYVLAGLIIAGLGFFAQHTTEQIGQPTIANNYALTAFLTSGFVGGLVYWVFRGRFAGGRQGASVAPTPPPHVETASPPDKPTTAIASKPAEHPLSAQAEIKSEHSAAPQPSKV